MSSLDINVEDEGFAYANAFLYDTQRNVLLYEINKNGCYLNLLKEYFYNTWNSTSDPTVKSKFSTNNFKKIRIPQFSETRFGSFVGLFLVYKQ